MVSTTESTLNAVERYKALVINTYTKMINEAEKDADLAQKESAEAYIEAIAKKTASSKANILAKNAQEAFNNANDENAETLASILTSTEILAKSAYIDADIAINNSLTKTAISLAKAAVFKAIIDNRESFIEDVNTRTATTVNTNSLNM